MRIESSLTMINEIIASSALVDNSFISINNILITLNVCIISKISIIYITINGYYLLAKTSLIHSTILL